MMSRWMKFWTGLILCGLAGTLQAADLLGGRAYMAPAKVYVNQPFELRFEVVATAGSQLEDVRVGGIPKDASSLVLGQMRLGEPRRENRETGEVFIYPLTLDARALKPLEHSFEPFLSCSLVERNSRGFFSQWRSYSRQIRLGKSLLKVLPLPREGRPADFSGAVGSFTLSGALSQNAVHTGDLVTLTLSLQGEGWLGNISLPKPAPVKGFKTYPAKEKLHTTLKRVTEQVWIPSDPQVTEIGAVSFSFFNPRHDRYERSSTGPFKLTFLAADEPKRSEQVKVIDASSIADSAPSLSTAVTLDQVNRSVRHFRPLIACGAGLLLALFSLFACLGRHTVAGIVLALLFLLSGGGIGLIFLRQNHRQTQILEAECEAYFAPSIHSAELFTLSKGAEFQPLERAGGWIRIDAAGRRGWIRMEAKTH